MLCGGLHYNRKECKRLANELSLKRNTTPAIPVRVDGVNYNSLSKVIVGFKSEKYPNAPLLFKKSYSKGDSHFSDVSISGFTLTMELTTEETFKLKAGNLFVDVYPVVGASVINTGIPIRYEVIDTLFDEVLL